MDIIDLTKSKIEFICSINFNEGDSWRIKTIDTKYGRKVAYFEYNQSTKEFEGEDGSEFEDEGRRCLTEYLLEENKTKLLELIEEYKLRFKYMGTDDLDYELLTK